MVTVPHARDAAGALWMHARDGARLGLAAVGALVALSVGVHGAVLAVVGNAAFAVALLSVAALHGGAAWAALSRSRLAWAPVALATSGMLLVLLAAEATGDARPVHALYLGLSLVMALLLLPTLPVRAREHA